MTPSDRQRPRHGAGATGDSGSGAGTCGRVPRVCQQLETELAAAQKSGDQKAKVEAAQQSLNQQRLMLQSAERACRRCSAPV